MKSYNKVVEQKALIIKGTLRKSRFEALVKDLEASWTSAGREFQSRGTARKQALFLVPTNRASDSVGTWRKPSPDNCLCRGRQSLRLPLYR